MLPIETNLAEKSARYLALLTVFDAPSMPQSPEHARSAELARILAFEPDRLSEITTLSLALLVERDFYAGCAPGVAYDIDDLASHFKTERTTMLSACKLCGAMSYHRRGRTVWADAEKVNYTFDSGAIDWANGAPPGRAQH